MAAATAIFGALEHRHYLKVHQHDEKFPLDGSDWARLVSMRLHPHPHEGAVFWLKLHSMDTPLGRERKAFHRGIHHWFIIGNDQYQVSLRYSSDDFEGDPVRRQLVNGLTEIGEEASLSQIENKWSTLSSSYWINADRGEWEGVSLGCQRITAIGKHPQSNN